MLPLITFNYTNGRNGRMNKDIHMRMVELKKTKKIYYIPADKIKLKAVDFHNLSRRYFFETFST